MIEERIERFLGNTDTVATAEEVKDSDQDAADAVNGASEQLLNGGRDASSIPPGEVPLQAPQLKRRSLEAEPTTDNAIMEGMKSLVKRARGNRASEIPKAPSWRDGWRWSPVEGASGWWQILMRGIWSDGVKIMKNQPCVVDVGSTHKLAWRVSTKLTSIDQHPLHSCSAARSKGILLFHFGLSETPASVLELLRVPLQQPTTSALRIRRLALSRYAGQQAASREVRTRASRR